jgi:hypothetical protein
MAFDVFGVILLQLILLYPLPVNAAQVVIDSTASTLGDSALTLGAVDVFISDQVGYTFYRDVTGQCVYSKTTNGGNSWSAAVLVDAQIDCIRISVWYDRWTPGDTTGTNIHIATLDTSDDDIFYNRLDTVSDTRLLGSTPVNTGVSTGQVPVISSAANSHTISKATNGTVFVALNDVSDSYALLCAANCNVTTSWTEASPRPFDLADDHNILMPLSGGQMMVINRDISANSMRSSIWNGSTWSAWNVFATGAIESGTFDGGFAATLDTETGDIYLAYATDHDDYTVADHDIRTAVYDGVGWTLTTDVFTDVDGRGLHDIGIAYDQNTGTIYIAYSIRTAIATATSANIYYRVSTNGMSSWGAEQGPVNTTPANIYTPSMNINNFERIYVSWWEPASDDRFGNTIADILPDTQVKTIGTMQSEVRDNTTNFYVGGAFTIESIAARTVSAITISETGTIDAQNDINNVKLFYDIDTTAPYNCSSESYSGSELQFGGIDTNGFSGQNGQSSFSGSIVNISPTATMCVYVVLDVLSSVNDGDTIDIEIANAKTDVTTSAPNIFPPFATSLGGSTQVKSSNLTLDHYHWRLDDGSETSATSVTGGAEDATLISLVKNTPRRLRIGVSNQGSTSTLPTQFRLEYGLSTPTCESVVTWTDVGAVNDDINMFDSTFITEGSNTTDILVANGGVSNGNTTFLTPNGGVRDVTSSTGSLTLGTTNFTELEYSIIASATASEGETYCFRVTNAGTPINSYAVYPTATIESDVRVSATGTQAAVIDIPTSNNYFGGVFAIRENTSSRSVTDVTLSEIGTVDAASGLANIKLFYKFDTSAPYNCASESYTGSELQYGATDANGFSAANGTSTFSGSVTITTSQALCLFVVADVTERAVNAQTVEFSINSASSEVTVSGGGSVAPSIPVTLMSSTTLRGGILTQNHYQWRNNDGTETTASSATGGVEDTPVTEFTQVTPIRLRLGVSNEGATSSVPTRFRIEYAPRITTCQNVFVWTDVEASPDDDWNMSDSVNLTNGQNTTNISVLSGGVSDENSSFLTANGGVRDTESLTGSTTLSQTQFTELEFSLTSTLSTAFNTNYCFRVTSNGTPLPAYTNYAELTTAPKRDFKIQQGNTILTGLNTTITAGVDYTAPSSSSTAFIRITNSQHTGAGRTSLGGAQNADDITAYISNPQNISTSITFNRVANVNQTFIDWEIIEFVGQPDTDNEMVVRNVNTVAMTGAQLSNTGAVVSGVADNSDVVVFVTGVRNSNTSRNYYAGQVTAEWDALNQRPVITRGATGAAPIIVSYAIVEYVGGNWKVQRAEHTYTVAGVASTTAITPVNSLERTFLHTQKRMGPTTNVASLGQTVWLSSIGEVSFQLFTGATIPQTSVAWVIENTQTGLGAAKVQRQNGSTINGAEPLTLQITLLEEVDAVNNTSLFVTTSANGVAADINHPRAISGARMTAVDAYQLWRSDTGSQMLYRSEVVEWPVADIALRQNYYRFYADNNELTPVDAWPPGANDLGENTSITINDEPLGDQELVRLRMSVRVANANLSPGLQAFKLQYAQRVSTCSAIETWSELGTNASSTEWRGFAATGTTDGAALSTNPPTVGDLLLSVSDTAGRLEHNNPSVANPYPVLDGEDVEYDWYVQHNGAAANSVYCFRMVRNDDSSLEGYLNYPQIRTAGFSPTTRDWRWYDDIDNETPNVSLAVDNSAPTNIGSGDPLSLRVTVAERKGVTGSDVKFKLQFSDDASFSNPIDVVASSSCAVNSLWCYADGVAADNSRIQNAVLTDGSGCVLGVGSGCGTHNESAEYVTGHLHGSSLAQEYSFTIVGAAPRVNAVYYFRLYDVQNNLVVPTGDGELQPSLLSEGSNLNFTVSGLPSGTSTAGIVTDATTTPTAISFGSLPINLDQIAAQRISVTTNATEGFQVLKYARQQLINSYGTPINPVTGSNSSPGSWSSVCILGSTSCFGYHTTDATLQGGSTRFAPTDTYSPLNTVAEEIIYSTIPTEETQDIVYRIRVSELQPAGDYDTDIVYIAVPVY